MAIAYRNRRRDITIKAFALTIAALGSLLPVECGVWRYLPEYSSLDDQRTELASAGRCRRFSAAISTNMTHRHLHLHVISSDLISPSLKTKKHYNSFNPKLGFFIPLEDADGVSTLRDQVSVIEERV